MDERSLESVLRTPPVPETKYPRRKIVKREPRIQTYRIYVTLECGHGWSFTVNARKYDQGWRGPKTFGCRRCPRVPK